MPHCFDAGFVTGCKRDRKMPEFMCPALTGWPHYIRKELINLEWNCRDCLRWRPPAAARSRMLKASRKMYFFH